MSTIKIPGLIDPHVHLRVPGGEQKEDFLTGSQAALAGGFTALLGMPNTTPPLVTLENFHVAQALAQKQSLCDVFLYAGASLEHLDALPALAQEAIALKIYLDQSFGDMKLSGPDALMRIAMLWPKDKLICFHAEGDSIAEAIDLAERLDRPVHICHVARRDELERIAKAKAKGLKISCEVTPHHLFLTETDAQRLGPFGDMRPRLQTQADQDALWEGVRSGLVDCIGSDHAPHARWEKLGFASASAMEQGAEGQDPNNTAPGSANKPHATPPGVPGLESTLPLMLTAVSEGRLSLDRALEMMSDAPRRLFKRPKQPDTWVELDLQARYSFPDHPLLTKCGWSPFEGWQMQGRALKTVFHGQTLYAGGQMTKPKIQE